MDRQGHSLGVILCVDDQETDAELGLLKSVLEREGYRVLTARSAPDALRACRDSDLDLVLTEHIMPTLGGPTLAATLKRLKPRLPVAIYSADWAELPEDMWVADAFITKLVPVDELLSAIEKLLAPSQTQAAA